MPTARESSDRLKDAKLKFLALTRQGLTIKECAAELGRHPRTVKQWLASDTRLRMMIEQARAAAGRDAARELSKEKNPINRLGEDVEPVTRDQFTCDVDYWVAFRKLYFGFDTFDHQYEIMYAWERAPHGGISLILVPPEGTKTTLLLDTLCADLCDNPNQHRAIVSESGDVASQMMGRVQRRMTPEGGQVPLMVQHFGPFQPLASDRTRVWNTSEMRLMNATSDSQDPTVLSVGMGGSIRNRRWDAVDVDDPQSVRYLSKTPNYLNIIRQDILTRPGAMGRVRFTSSRVGRGDLFEEMIRNEMVAELVIIPALDNKGRSYFPLQFDPQGAPILDPQTGNQMGWTEDMLAQRRKLVGEDHWSRVYMQEPESDFTSALTADDIQAATDGGRMVGEPAGVGVICGLDPSLQAHAAYMVTSYDAERLYVTAAIDQFRAVTFGKIFETIDHLSSRYKPTYWVIEDNALQSGFLKDDAFVALRDKHGFFASGHHTTAQKKDDMMGIPAMFGAILRGEIRFPRVTEADVAMHELYEQLIRWRPDIPTKFLKQDLVMSLYFVWHKWRALRETLEASVEQWRRQGLADPTLYPYAKTHLAMPTPRAVEKVQVTYEQQWATLSGAGQ